MAMPVRKPGILTFFFVLLFVGLFVFVYQGRGFFISEAGIEYLPMTPEQSIYVCLLGMVVFIVLELIAKRSYKATTNWFILVMACIVGFSGAMGALLNLGDVTHVSTGAVVYTFTEVEKIQYALISLLNGMAFYLSFDIIPKTIANAFYVRLSYRILILFALLSICYSFIFETELWIDTFKTLEVSGLIHSWFPNKNTFACVLFVGMCAETLLVAKAPRWWRWASMLLMGGVQILMLSRTHLLISSVLVIFILILAYARSVKTHKVRNNLILAGVLLAFIGGITYWVLRGSEGSDALQSLLEIIESFMTSGARNLKGRYDYAAELVNLTFEPGIAGILFGRGFKSFVLYYQGTYEGHINWSRPIDVQWAYAIGSGGVLTLAVEIIMWIYVIAKVVSVMDKDYKEAPFAFAVLGSVLIRTFFEAGGFTTMEPFSMSFFIIVAYGPLAYKYRLKHPEFDEASIASYSIPRKKRETPLEPGNVYLRRILCLTSVWVGLGLVMPFFLGDVGPEKSLSVMFGILAFAILGTYLFGSFATKPERKSDNIIPMVFVIPGLVISFVLPWYLDPVTSALITAVFYSLWLALTTYFRLLVPLSKVAYLFIPYFLSAGSIFMLGWAGVNYLGTDGGFLWILMPFAVISVFAVTYLVPTYGKQVSGFEQLLGPMDQAFDRFVVINEAKLDELYYRKIEANAVERRGMRHGK